MYEVYQWMIRKSNYQNKVCRVTFCEYLKDTVFVQDALRCIPLGNTEVLCLHPCLMDFRNGPTPLQAIV